MRPGKLLRLMDNASTWPTVCEEKSNGRLVLAGTVFLVVSTTPQKTFKKVINYYDLHRPWLILISDKVELIDALDRPFLDITPFRYNTI